MAEPCQIAFAALGFGVTEVTTSSRCGSEGSAEETDSEDMGEDETGDAAAGKKAAAPMAVTRFNVVAFCCELNLEKSAQILVPFFVLGAAAVRRCLFWLPEISRASFAVHERRRHAAHG